MAVTPDQSLLLTLAYHLLWHAEGGRSLRRSNGKQTSCQLNKPDCRPCLVCTLFSGSLIAPTTSNRSKRPCLQDGESGESRAWLLPLLRQNVASTSLAFWGDSLLPLARSLVERASVTPAGGQEGLTGLQMRVLEAQIWNILPSFCCWPVDMAAAFQYESSTRFLFDFLSELTKY